MMIKRLNLIALFLLFIATASALRAGDTVSVTVRANVNANHQIQLRWAARSPSAWYYTNRNGVVVERYTLVRDGKRLEDPEKKLLTAKPLKPRPLGDWQEIATHNNYAAIIAQALYGDDFEVSGGETDIAQVIALSQEQEQRFAMSLFAADLSFPAALFAGWGVVDDDVRHGERYLYRVTPVCPDKKKVVEPGSAYIGPDDYSPLPKPVDVAAAWGNGSVMLTWNSQILERTYNAYRIERSEGGGAFRPLTDTPLTNLTGGSRMFYTDSIINGRSYSYRVSGLTPFGETGPASDTISGSGKGRLIYNPHILKAVPDKTGKVEVAWEFDKEGEKELSSFELRRGATDKGPFVPVASNIPPSDRSVLYEKPLPENYLVVAAIPREGEETVSFPFLLQMEDSIPPAVPVGLEGAIDSMGVAHIRWTPNRDADLLGYRVFRAQTAGEEPIPLTDIALSDTTFADTVRLFNLNRHVYYAVTALDKRYNQSALSAPLELEKPDLVPPSPPFITACKPTANGGVRLTWVAGDEALQAFDIYRAPDKGKRELIKTVPADSIAYTDSTTQAETPYRYDVVAVSKGYLESDPSPSLYVKTGMKNTTVQIKSFKARRTGKGILLRWELTSPTEAKSATLYRKAGEEPLQLWQTVDPLHKTTTDESARTDVSYEYMLMIKNKAGMPVSKTIKVE
jgi:fibronectin type 3 domain-containing protein